MDEENKDIQVPEQQEPFSPAPKSKRIAAWVGVILMILLVILYSYSIATGAFLNW